MAKSEYFFPLGEIAKCRRVNRKTCEINSSSEESEADEDNSLEEPVEVEQDDDFYGGERKSDSDEDSEKYHREEDGKEKKSKKKYGKGMKVLDLQLSHGQPPPFSPSLTFFASSVDNVYRHNSKRYACTYRVYRQVCGRGCGEGGSE